MAFDSNFFQSESEKTIKNTLVEYLQNQHPETLERVAQSATQEVKEIINHNVQGLLGVLPSEDFNVQIVTDKQHLVNLLASAMMTGYFLSQMEQRKNLEDCIGNSDSL